MKVISNKVSLAMVRACIDPKELAIRANISYPAVKRVLSGHEVKPSTLGKICKALQIDPAELVEKE